jgi:dethiobiotin synthetase
MSVRGLFVTGTDTGVGKTLVTAAMAAAFARRGLRIGVLKPVETGCPPRIADVAPDLLSARNLPTPTSEPTASAVMARPFPCPPIYPSRAELCPRDAEYLLRWANTDLPLDLVNPYRYALPVAPALAARVVAETIEFNHIASCLNAIAQSTDLVLVEGAGGLLVPLTDTLLVLDLIVYLELPVLVVARSSLGTINHTLLTLRTLHQRDLPIAGVVLNRCQKEPAPDEPGNALQVEQFAGDVLRGVMPYFNEREREDQAYLADRCSVHLDLDRILSTIQRVR